MKNRKPAKPSYAELESELAATRRVIGIPGRINRQLMELLLEGRGT